MGLFFLHSFGPDFFVQARDSEKTNDYSTKYSCG